MAEENILLRVKAHILAHPETFGMKDFAGDQVLVGVKEAVQVARFLSRAPKGLFLHTCKEAHCIGGWVIALSGIAFNKLGDHPDAVAAKLIGLPFDSSDGTHPLFYTEDWPFDLAEAYFLAKTNEQAAAAAGAAIDRYLADPANFGRDKS